MRARPVRLPRPRFGSEERAAVPPRSPLELRIQVLPAVLEACTDAHRQVERPQEAWWSRR